VKSPFRQFVDHMILRIQEFEPDLVTTAKESVFRINRDIRFSKDKTPYKTHVSAVLGRGGKKSADPAYYFQFNHQQVMVGGGAYFLEKDDLYKVRQEIAYETETFNQLLANPDFKKAYGEVLGDRNKVLPAEFKEDRERQPLIANKQFYYMAELPASTLLAPDLDEQLLRYFKTAAPLNAFFRHALKG